VSLHCIAPATQILSCQFLYFPITLLKRLNS